MTTSNTTSRYTDECVLEFQYSYYQHSNQGWLVVAVYKRISV